MSEIGTCWKPNHFLFGFPNRTFGFRTFTVIWCLSSIPGWNSDGRSGSDGRLDMAQGFTDADAGVALGRVLRITLCSWWILHYAPAGINLPIEEYTEKNHDLVSMYRFGTNRITLRHSWPFAATLANMLGIEGYHSTTSPHPRIIWRWVRTGDIPWGARADTGFHSGSYKIL